MIIRPLTTFRNCLLTLFAVIVIAGLAAPAAALNGTSHKVVARIAWANMNANTRALVDRLLISAPADSGLRYAGPSGTDLRLAPLTRFELASVWPDLVKVPNRDYNKYNCWRWHFMNMYWRQDGLALDPSLLQRQEVDLVERLTSFARRLPDSGELDENRAIELAWMVHQIGDLHQPLHVINRITSEFPAGDLGANKVQVILRGDQGGRTTNLHAFWDSVLTLEFAKNENEEDTAYIDRLARLLMAEYPAADVAGRLSPGRFKDWALESFELGKTAVYGRLRGRTLDADYRKNALKTMESQLALAGYRLAALLNGLLGDVANSAVKKQELPERQIRMISFRAEYDLACGGAYLREHTLELVPIKITDAEGKPLFGYNAGEVRSIVEKAKQHLLMALSGPELAGLRAYAEAHFPPADNLTVLPASARGALAAPQRYRLRHVIESRHSSRIESVQPQVATAESSNGLFALIASIFSVTRDNSGAITITVTSMPEEGANIELQSPGGKRYTSSTNAPVPNFWPGTYNIKMTMDGYVTIIQERVEIGFGGASRIICPLIKSGQPRFCQVQ